MDGGAIMAIPIPTWIGWTMMLFAVVGLIMLAIYHFAGELARRSGPGATAERLVALIQEVDPETVGVTSFRLTWTTTDGESGLNFWYWNAAPSNQPESPVEKA